MKKLVCSICIAFLLLISFHTNVEAKTPNVKDCIENIEDCSDTAEINVDDNEGESDLTSTDKKNKPLVFDLIKMVLALLLVLGLIYFLLKLLNKRNNLIQQKSMENLGGISVGPNKSVQIIRVGSKLYLIGVGDNIEKLEEIEDEATIDELLNQTTEKDSFQIGTLLSSFSKKNQDKDESATHPTDQQFKKLFSNELANLKENRRELIKQHKKRIDNNE